MIRVRGNVSNNNIINITNNSFIGNKVAVNGEGLILVMILFTRMIFQAATIQSLFRILLSEAILLYLAQVEGCRSTPSL